MTRRGWGRIVACALVFGVAAGTPAASWAQSDTPTVVILVRHAERADDGSEPDPPLSDRGRSRAECLAETLAHAGVTRVFSTPYLRTMHTARPVAARLGLEVETYDPRSLGSFAASLDGMGGVVLVVGHSNTTPRLVEALGADPVQPIAEDEYDRLHTVFLSGTAVAGTLTRFCPAG
ncbi:MAG: histidine phosphatase family protein [Longimicrobiales bacterium]|nr:histidine phosphatase family protein [Longimicrobiales bacterium]